MSEVDRPEIGVARPEKGFPTMTALKTTTIAELPRLVGTVIGSSDWVEVSQQRIDTLADATDDHQWIHVDPERASKGPFGALIAHGFLTLSLFILGVSGVIEIEGEDRPAAVVEFLSRVYA